MLKFLMYPKQSARQWEYKQGKSSGFFLQELISCEQVSRQLYFTVKSVKLEKCKSYQGNTEERMPIYTWRFREDPTQ